MLMESKNYHLADNETALAWGRTLPYSCGPNMGWRFSPLREKWGPAAHACGCSMAWLDIRPLGQANLSPDTHVDEALGTFKLVI